MLMPWTLMGSSTNRNQTKQTTTSTRIRIAVRLGLFPMSTVRTTWSRAVSVVVAMFFKQNLESDSVSPLSRNTIFHDTVRALARSPRRRRNRNSTGVRGVKSRQLQQQLFQFAIVFVLRQLVLFLAIQQHGAFEGVAPRRLFRRETLLRVAANQMQLLREKAIDGRSFFGLFDRPQADEPIGRCAQAVAVVVEQGVLVGQPAFGLVESGGLARSG